MNVHSLLEKVADISSLAQKEQIKLMAFFYCHEYDLTYFNPTEIALEFEKQYLKVPSNISRNLNELCKWRSPFLLKNKNGFSFHRDEKRILEEKHLEQKHLQEVSQTLRDLIKDINGNEQKNFIEEAIKCFECSSYRAAIILTWLLCMDILYEDVLSWSNLVIFNSAIQSHGKYKKNIIFKKDDFSDIKEVDFIELLRVAKLITNDMRKILDEKLWIRNSCAHPNGIKILDYKAIAFIQDLVSNIIKIKQSK